jgi:uncharacterized protein (TIGR00730 family)
MGLAADACLQAHGEVTGVIPQFLVDKEIAHRELRDLRIVNSMHQRKALMAELSDAFIALPGGFGTLEEFFEVLTWTQLRLQEKPCGMLNVLGYYDSIVRLADHAVGEGFLKISNRQLLIVQPSVSALLQSLEDATFPPGLSKFGTEPPNQERSEASG